MLKLYNKSNFKILIFSFFSTLKINFVGSLPISELLAFIDVLSFNRTRNLVFHFSDLKKVLIAYFIFFISQLTSDIINGSDLNDSLRGISNIIMAGVVIIYLWKYLFLNLNIIIGFLMIYMLGRFFFGNPIDDSVDVFEEISVFKFGIAPYTNNIVLVLSILILRFKANGGVYVFLLFAIYGLISLGLDFRSNGIIFFFTGVIFLLRKLISRTPQNIHLFYLIAAILFFQLFYSIYVSNVFSGDIGGDHAKEQFDRMKNPYNPLELLETGRGVTFVALEAISDSPIIGHGSWAPDPDGKYTYMLFKEQGLLHKFNTYQSKKGDLIIPSHSILLGAWMTSGIVGFLSIVFILFLFWKRSYFLIRNYSLIDISFLPIIIFYFFSISWNFMFSPLPHLRQSVPIMLVFVLLNYYKATHYYNKNYLLK